MQIQKIRLNKKPQMKIRKYNIKDEKEVKGLIKTVLWEIFGRHKIPAFENFEQYDYFFVVEENKIIIASIAMKITEDIGIIKRLYLKKEYRNRGIAQKLYNRIEKIAIKEKLQKLTLSTTPQMKQAIRFYTKNGFKKTHKDVKANSIFFAKALK
jgi:N-acetylglutamate synthase-like GNAT family acetyltransferase